MVNMDSEMWNVVVQYFVTENQWDLERATRKADDLRKKGLLAKAYKLVQR